MCLVRCWRTTIKNANPADDNKIQTFDKEQMKIQGLTAATMKVNAEPIRAFEIALEETETSIGLLRFFSPVNFNPEKTSHCVVFGKENLESTKHVLEEGNLVQINKTIVDIYIQPWVTDDVNLSLFQKGGLEILSDILTLENRTEFQQRLLSSLKWYSNGSLIKNPSEIDEFMLDGDIDWPDLGVATVFAVLENSRKEYLGEVRAYNWEAIWLSTVDFDEVDDPEEMVEMCKGCL